MDDQDELNEEENHEQEEIETILRELDDDQILLPDSIIEQKSTSSQFFTCFFKGKHLVDKVSENVHSVK